MKTYLYQVNVSFSGPEAESVARAYLAQLKGIKEIPSPLAFAEFMKDTQNKFAYLHKVELTRKSF